MASSKGVLRGPRYRAFLSSSPDDGVGDALLAAALANGATNSGRAEDEEDEEVGERHSG